MAGAFQRITRTGAFLRRDQWLSMILLFFYMHRYMCCFQDRCIAHDPHYTRHKSSTGAHAPTAPVLVRPVQCVVFELFRFDVNFSLSYNRAGISVLAGKIPKFSKCAGKE